MNKREYNHQILKKIEKSIDGLLPIGSLIAILGIVNVYFTGRNLLLAIYDFVLAAALLILFTFRKRILPAYKIAVICLLIFVIAYMSLVLTGIIGVGLQLLVLCSILVVGFFSNQISALYAFTKTVLLILFLLMIQFDHIQYSGSFADVSNDPKNWYMPLILITLLDMVLILVIYAIKQYLISSIKTSDAYEKRILQLAFYDPLTNLPNKANLLDAFAHQSLNNTCVIQFRIDGFSMMNSIYGNPVTDQLIIRLAEDLNAFTQNGHFVARIGGNEFVWIIKEPNLDQVIKQYDQFVTALQQYEEAKYARRFLHFSAGYLTTGDVGIPITGILEKTTIALEQSKLQNSSELMPYNQESEMIFLEQEKLKSELTKAIRDRSFKIYYQEKVDTKLNQTFGVEALARWELEGRGSISPNIFIPLLKKVNATLHFDLMITEQVFREYTHLMAKYGASISVSINISPLSLITQTFIDEAIRLSDDYRMDPSHVYFELTEDAFFENFEIANQGIEQLRDKGFKISIDDFGSGYTALSYIFKLKFDELKMDRSFVNQLANNHVNRAILSTVINLRDIDHFSIVAEGVETPAECELLQQMGCWQVQGYLFSKPLPCVNCEALNEN